MIGPTFRTTASVIATCAVFASVANAEDVDISFILTGDVDLMSNPDGRGGLDKVLGVVAGERARAGDNALFIHAGDAYSPSLMSRFDQGAHIVDLLNLEAPDIFVPGNHEFDFGEDIFRQRVADSDFPILAANLGHADNMPAGITPSAMIEVDGVRIGFVGGIEEDAAELSDIGTFTLGPVLDAADAAAAQLREDGADFIVAVLSTSKSVDEEAIASHAFDMVLSGDDHDLVAFYNGITVQAEAGSQGDYVVIVDVAFDVTDGDRGRRVRWHPNFRILDTADVAPLPEAAKLVATLDASLSEELDEVVFTLPIQLESTKALVRTEETALGNLIADAVRAATGADVAMVNSGSIRGNKIYDAGHEFTFRDVLTELPFGNTTVMIGVDGATLRKALENSVSQLEDKAGRFMQVSGLSFSYDPAADVGARVGDVMIGDAALDDTATYRLAINNYVLGGGDGFDMFGDSPVLIDRNSGDKVSNQVISYLQRNASPQLGLSDRITVAD